MSRGIQNVECDIRPPNNNKEAIPEEATVTTICPKQRNFVAIVLYINVLPVHAPPLKKNVVPLSINTDKVISI